MLDAMVDASYDRVWRLCAGMVDEQSAADLAQESFIRVFRALPTFAGDSSALTWILSITRHACLDELRARDRRRRRQRSLEAMASSQAAAHDAAQDALVKDLLVRLDEDRRAAFVLTQILGLSYDDAARICNCPVGTIRSRVARARDDLVELVSRPHPHTRARRGSRASS